MVALVAGAGRGKGSLLIHTKDYVLQKYGESAWNEALAASSPADREVLEGILLIGGWYPIGVANRLVDRVCHVMHRGSPDEEMARVSAFIADRDLGSVYKMVLSWGSPGFLAKRTGSLWNRYFDVGVLTPTQLEENHWRLRLAMPVGEDRAPNKLFCGPGCPAWIEMGLRLTGASHASVKHVACRYDNGEACEYDVRW